MKQFLKQRTILHLLFAVMTTLIFFACSSGKPNKKMESSPQPSASQIASANKLDFSDAVLSGNTTKVKDLLATGVDVNSSPLFYPPIGLASLKGHVAVVQILLNHGANSNESGWNHVMPLHLAAKGGYSAVVQMLLAHGAKINEQVRGGSYTMSMTGFGSDLLIVMDGSSTALYLASQNGHEAVVKLLLDKGADVNLPADGGKTPLSVAASSRIAQMLKELEAK